MKRDNISPVFHGHTASQICREVGTLSLDGWVLGCCI